MGLDLLQNLLFLPKLALSSIISFGGLREQTSIWILIFYTGNIDMPIYCQLPGEQYSD